MKKVFLPNPQNSEEFRPNKSQVDFDVVQHFDATWFIRMSKLLSKKAWDHYYDIPHFNCMKKNLLLAIIIFPFLSTVIIHK